QVTPALGDGQVAVQRVGRRYRCQRCQQWVQPEDWLPNGAWYCRHCLQLGRVTSQTKLYTIPEPNRFTIPPPPILTWTGKLSDDQQRAARAVRDLTQQKQN